MIGETLETKCEIVKGFIYAVNDKRKDGLLQEGAQKKNTNNNKTYRQVQQVIGEFDTPTTLDPSTSPR